MNKYKRIDKYEANYFEILKVIKKKPTNTQRTIASELGFSLGKLNYFINELRKKGLIKIKNFKSNPKKLKYFYYLTPKGLSLKTKLTVNFMKRKLQEYHELKKELESEDEK